MKWWNLQAMDDNGKYYVKQDSERKKTHILSHLYILASNT